jgi:hypothetical protein
MYGDILVMRWILMMKIMNIRNKELLKKMGEFLFKIFEKIEKEQQIIFKYRGKRN